jgi:hypothetical protein
MFFLGNIGVVFNSELRYNYIMQMLHTSLGKSKKKKPTAKQRELNASWETMLKKYENKKLIKPQSDAFTYSLGTPACRETPKIPSLPFTGGPCALKPNPVYTGTKVKGIGTMHKSNAVPVFSDEEARDIATMRRG